MKHRTNKTPQEMLAELNDVSAALPNRTLFGLAMSGLQRRLTRSMVTLISVVLAIAYLSYSGVNSALLYHLANADVDEIKALLRAAGVNTEITRAGDPLDRWLIIMALLTCAVGIANAMLMSVTERFREIGTMKCLGAEDSIVVKLFLIESSLMGMVGSLGGIIIVLIICFGVNLAQYGKYAIEYMPGGTLLKVASLSLLAGMVLCVIGAGYPALVAARMRPVEALRVEE